MSQRRSVGRALDRCRVALCAHVRSRHDAQRTSEKGSSRSHPRLSERQEGGRWQGKRNGIQLCSRQRQPHKWERSSKGGKTQTNTGRKAERHRQRKEGIVKRPGPSEQAQDGVRCSSITNNVPVLSELLVRAPPRNATRWSTHERTPVHYAGASRCSQQHRWLPLRARSSSVGMGHATIVATCV